jgi:hypothetical protein
LAGPALPADGLILGAFAARAREAPNACAQRPEEYMRRSCDTPISGVPSPT